MERRRHTSKTKASKIHFHKRSIERVGFIVDANRIIHQIQHSEASLCDLTFIKKCSNRVTKWELMLEDKVFIVIYDKIRKCLVTIYERVELNKIHHHLQRKERN